MTLDKISSVKKSAIYVDIDDDLTAIVSKVTSSNADTVAIVPPKRIGILQSAVNLKLLNRAAKTKHKKLILITADNTLATLAASAEIPVAHSLSAEPKLAKSPEFDSDDEIIQGSDLSIGELDKSSPRSEDKKMSAAVKAIADDDKINLDDDEPPKPTKKSKVKVPNFNKFRKWMIFAIIGGVGLIALLIWLFFFATSAKITITAKTSDEKIDQSIMVLNDGQTNPDNYQIQAIKAEPIKKTNEVEFTASGKKDIGEKAKGQILIINSDSLDPITLSAGTYVSINGNRYTLNSTVTVPKVTGTMSSPVNGEVLASITAEVMGPEYNTGNGVSAVVAGYASGSVATSGGGIGGGSKETVTIVDQKDIDAVTDKLKADAENSNIKSELEGRFGNGIRPISDSFRVDFGNIVSSPAVGERADKGKASVEVTYSMVGLNDSDLNSLLMTAARSKIAQKSNQGVFDDGFKSVQVLSYQNTDSGGTARLVTVAKIGPDINDEKIKQDAVGKKANEIKDFLLKIDGVQDVDVSFFPFWITTGPATEKTTIEKIGF
jgi:hypothetical protein